MSFKFIRYFMDVAKLTANLSHAKRLKVGSIIVKDNRIISIGYNGTPAGWDNNCEHEVNGKLITKDEVIHAEENAILKLARDGESGKDTTMYVTHAPCIRCARLIYNAGVSSIYYEIPYRDTSGIDFLQKCGISVQKIGGNVQELTEKVENNTTKILTREQLKKRLHKLWIIRSSDKQPVLIEHHSVVSPEKSNECFGVINVYLNRGSHERLYTSAIHNTLEEVFDEISDILYNMYEREEIIIQED